MSIKSLYNHQRIEHPHKTSQRAVVSLRIFAAKGPKIDQKGLEEGKGRAYLLLPPERLYGDFRGIPRNMCPQRKTSIGTRNLVAKRLAKFLLTMR